MVILLAKVRQSDNEIKETRVARQSFRVQKEGRNSRMSSAEPELNAVPISQKGGTEVEKRKVGVRKESLASLYLMHTKRHTL